MEYLEQILWLISWPLMIYISFKVVQRNIKKI